MQRCKKHLQIIFKKSSQKKKIFDKQFNIIFINPKVSQIFQNIHNIFSKCSFLDLSQ